MAGSGKAKVIVGGGLVVLLLAIGALIGQFAGLGFGLGGGGGGDGGGGSTESRPPTRPADSEPSQAKPSESPEDPDDGALVVRIEKDTYLVGGPDAFQTVRLADVVDRAKQTKGNAQGVRVRIQRADTAIAIAWKTLRDKLVAAGLNDAEIEWDRDPPP